MNRMLGGLNIPLTVNALQKQIKQYITSCSGVDVHKVRVMVETDARSASEADAQPAPDTPVPVMAAPLADGIEEPILRHAEETVSYAVSPEEPAEDAQEATEQPPAASDESAMGEEEDDSAPDTPARKETIAAESVEGEEQA